MDHILPAYSDPLFSILLLVAMLLIIAVVSYLFRLYKVQKEQDRLYRFLGRFESHDMLELEESFEYSDKLYEPLLLLAKGFEQAGEYPKAISLYRYLLKHNDTSSNRWALMQELGALYMHAGFFERAGKLFLEILRHRPRQSEVLHMLMLLYEKSKRYDEAEEVIEALEALDEAGILYRDYLFLLKLQDSDNETVATHKEQIVSLAKSQPRLLRTAIALLFRIDSKQAWEMVKECDSAPLLDILYRLPEPQPDLDIIKADKVLHVLFYIKGTLEEFEKPSGHFMIDLAAYAKAGGCQKVLLEFAYRCDSCKQRYPFSFLRCPGCNEIATLNVDVEIIGREQKTSDALY